MGGGSELESLAKVVEDYESLELDADQHTALWLGQFPSTERRAVARSLAAALATGYTSRLAARRFVDSIRHLPTGPGRTLLDCQFLDLFEQGHSQAELLQSLAPPVTAPPMPWNSFAYVDDLLITGSRAATDLTGWVASAAPEQCEVHLVVIRAFEHGLRRALLRVEETAVRYHKRVQVTVWTSHLVKDCPWQVAIDPVLLTSGAAEPDRAVLERGLARAGVRICSGIRHRPDYCRPLGFSTQRPDGFGALVATHRTCPNHAPLAIWYSPVDSSEPPWWPLLRRSRRKQVEERHDMRAENFQVPAPDRLRAVVPDVRTIPAGAAR